MKLWLWFSLSNEMGLPLHWDYLLWTVERPNCQQLTVYILNHLDIIKFNTSIYSSMFRKYVDSICTDQGWITSQTAEVYALSFCQVCSHILYRTVQQVETQDLRNSPTLFKQLQRISLHTRSLEPWTGQSIYHDMFMSAGLSNDVTDWLQIYWLWWATDNMQTPSTHTGDQIKSQVR